MVEEPVCDGQNVWTAQVDDHWRVYAPEPAKIDVVAVGNQQGAKRKRDEDATTGSQGGQSRGRGKGRGNGLGRGGRGRAAKVAKVALPSVDEGAETHEFHQKRLRLTDLGVATDAFGKYSKQLARMKGESLMEYINADGGSLSLTSKSSQRCYGRRSI